MGERIFDNLFLLRTPRLAPRVPGSRCYSEMKWLPDPDTGLTTPEEIQADLDQGATIKGWQFIVGQRIHGVPTEKPACRVHEIRLALVRRQSVTRIERWARVAVVSDEEIPSALR